ncbi:MAG: TolC family protein, partial [Candidatus Regiella insecticola]|nr:TolC family protein [Candidatus Regiella insecticola]
MTTVGGLDAGYSYSQGFLDNSNSNIHVTSGNVVLKQTIFNMSQWRNLTSKEKQANIQNIIFQANKQKLILDTATSYFDVLLA